MKKQLEQYFGCKVEVVEYKGKLQLPIFMTLRHICIVELAGVEFALINIAAESELSVAVMKKQQRKYEEALQCPVAYKVAINSMAMRNALVKNGISFIDMPGNVFLPFMGIVLQDNYTRRHIRTDKMMPATQMVFLELMYMNDDQSILKSEIAGKLNLTKTSITRATAQLNEMGLILQSKSGTEISVRRNMPRREYYEKAKEFLINPIQKVITVLKTEPDRNMMWCAGETALSRETQLNPPRIEEMAVYKGNEAVNQFEMVDERLEAQEQIVRIQLWKYNPSYFANGGSVDMISLACSFIGNEDERIEMSIEELLEDI
jgi:DNA-binding MarR family transcriptional regulator